MSKTNSFNYKYYDGPKTFGTSARSILILIQLLGLTKVTEVYQVLGLIHLLDLIKQILLNGI